jgi:hypothetical protein
VPAADVERIRRRAKKAFAETSQWHSAMRDAYKYAMPSRNEYDIVSPGAKKGTDVFDSTAIRGVKKFANRIVSGMFPAGRDWAKLEAGPLAPIEQKGEIAQVLEEATKTVFSIMHTATNFQTAIGEFGLDLVAGTACMLINPGTLDEPIVYQTVPPVHVGLEEGANGKVCGVYRRPKVTARDLKEQWADARPSPDIAKAMTEKPDDLLDKLLEATYYDSKSKLWYYEVICERSGSKIVSRKYNSSPWIVTRWMKCSNEVAGRGPLLDATPDIKTINKLVELSLMSAALAVSGVYTAVDDGVLNPDTVRIVPGAMIAVARNQGHPSGASLAPLERAGDFDVSQIEHERLAGSINGLLANNALPPEAGPVRSATEYIQRAKDMSEDLGASFGRLVSEAMIPIMQRTLDILIDRNLIKLPAGVRRIQVGGGGVKLTVTSPLAQLQNLDDVDAIARTVETSNALVGKDLTMLALKIEEIPTQIAEKLGFPASLIRSKPEQKRLVEMVAGMMAAEQMSGTGNMSGMLQQVGQPGGALAAA